MNQERPQEGQQTVNLNRRFVGRRTVLKTLATTAGVTAAASLLPSKWTRPIVDLGVLPAHAQMSPQPHAISCGAYFVPQQESFVATCSITPAASGVSMALEILINGEVKGSLTAITDASGNASLPVNPVDYGWNWMDPVSVRWSFTDPLYGSATCVALLPMPNGAD